MSESITFDIHGHSTFSDGHESPEEVAREAGLYHFLIPVRICLGPPTGGFSPRSTLNLINLSDPGTSSASKTVPTINSTLEKSSKVIIENDHT